MSSKALRCKTKPSGDAGSFPRKTARKAFPSRTPRKTATRTWRLVGLSKRATRSEQDNKFLKRRFPFLWVQRLT